MVNYQYDAANRLLVSSSPGHSVSYTWDNNSNLLSDGLRSYSYDHANRLVQVVSGALTTQFVYDGYVPNHIKRANELLSIGNRVQTVVDGRATDYVMDVASPLPQVLAATTGGQSSYYLHGTDLIGQYDSGIWAYHLSDALGSVRSLTDPAGQVVSSYSFSPFGVPLGESGGDPYGYTGELWENRAELLYLRARWYEPGTGRFTQRDVWRGDHLRPQSLHPYVYVENNAINFIDPSGQTPTIPDGFVVGRATNLTGGIAGVRWLNAVYRLAGACQLPQGQVFNVAGFGTETVYDFVHRQKQQFDFAYYGIDPLQLAGIEHSWYEGLAMGFQAVEDIENYAGLNLVKAPPAGLSFSAVILEAGGGMSFSEAIQRPGVDVVDFGLNLEFGLGWPGPALEEGGTGVYWGLVATAPADTPENIRDLATLESEIRRSTLLITEVAIQSARFWWYWGAQQ